MPFFSYKLNKKAPRRKIVKPQGKHEKDYAFDSAITLKLGEIKTTFSNGQWIPEFGPFSETSKENLSLKMQLTKLEEENNLLKLKYEILLDMVSIGKEW